MSSASKPLIVQSDRTLLLDVHAKGAEDVRAAILPFAELEKSPEHIHTYRISPLSLWNAASAGLTPADVVKTLNAYSRYEVPEGITGGFADTMARYGRIRLRAEPPGQSAEAGATAAGAAPGTEKLLLVTEDSAVEKEIAAARTLGNYLTKTEGGFVLKLTDRGTVKQELIKLGWPVEDEAPLREGAALEIGLRDRCVSGQPFILRDYQAEAARSVLGNGGPGTGFGVVVLPCGSGKTIVGMTVMALLKTSTLILSANVAAVHQWIDELLDKTTLTRDQIAEYSGDSKAVAPVTIATYQILTWRPAKGGDFPHFTLFRTHPWGLIIYDEVHLLPAPVFRVTAELQAVRRLGLTATLVREDGAEDAMFSLVGPKRYDVPWKDLERKGWIAEAFCVEVRLDLPGKLKIPYAVAGRREKYRIAAENPRKEEAALELIANHPLDHILVIGQYISQLESIARLLKAPLVTGKTPNAERERIYGAFKKGDLKVMVVSKVANFALDLPDASMAVQISGSFGSRQEEAQRLGRILRPKENKNSYFYTIVSRATVEEDFAANRQKFLAEQGYRYSIQHWTEGKAEAVKESR
ncbi:MAG: DEAD/DEAH box helicase [Spirochaetaceae bacterium]|jgi:DNA excision repair protein ERCC-3|nr:DEAD/DEAH box helicase [Spirochaetaceae bacterium]